MYEALASQMTEMNGVHSVHCVWREGSVLLKLAGFVDKTCT